MVWTLFHLFIKDDGLRNPTRHVQPHRHWSSLPKINSVYVTNVSEPGFFGCKASLLQGQGLWPPDRGPKMSCQYVELEFFLFQAMLWDVSVTVVTQVLFVEGSSSGYKLER